MSEFSHYTDGKPVMVDVGGKEVTTRVARAAGCVFMQKETIEKIQKNLIPKGNPFDVARVAGILAAKKTHELIPMCHPLMITHVDIAIVCDNSNSRVSIEATVRCDGKTGVEMEALTAVSVACLTIYDMCKAVDKQMVIGDIRLVEKHGGKSDYVGK
ncbi:MAG: cyclic pyranopterin monophosphate synthase MoaC [Spirochaetota bacterium]